jgi:hypothetical protein
MLAFWQWQSNPPTTVVCPDTAFSLSLHQYWYMTVVLAPHTVSHHTILLSLTNCSCHVVPQYWFLSHTVWVVTTRCYSAQNAHQVRGPYNICTPNLSNSDLTVPIPWKRHFLWQWLGDTTCYCLAWCIWSNSSWLLGDPETNVACVTCVTNVTNVTNVTFV